MNIESMRHCLRNSLATFGPPNEDDAQAALAILTAWVDALREVDEADFKVRRHELDLEEAHERYARGDFGWIVCRAIGHDLVGFECRTCFLDVS